jgi:acyl-CoA synthetase (AMP-forming)/AMP-acid ligase II
VTIDLAGHQSVGGAFLERAAEHPDRAALTIYRGSAAPDTALDFAELARRAGLRAQSLAERLGPGERVMIALPTGTEFVELYLACMLAGLVAVPVPELGGSAGSDRVAVIAGDCRPALAFTTLADLEAMADRLRSHGLGHVPVEEPGEVGPGRAPAGLPAGRGVSRDTLAVLQYSSGSTDSPKGVLLSHGSILSNVWALRHCAGIGTPTDVFGSWMPLHHDFGLFVQLTTAMLNGVPTVLMSPSDFVRRPVQWLRMLDRYGITVTSAPDFAYGLCLRLIQDQHLDGIDLSRLRCLVNGSEPIHAPTMIAFAKRFATIGLRPEAFTPGYGLAETTVYVSSTALDLPPTVLVVDPRIAEDADRPRLATTTGGAGKEVVGVGKPAAHETRIVDPGTVLALPEGLIGELWLRGDSLGLGYWGKPELSAQIFQAHLADDPADAPGWLRTGDLGAFVDGELFITGRLKEMVIVRGRNLFPHDIEQQARLASPALEGFLGAAFAVAAPDERIVLIHEVDPRTPAEDLPGVATDVLRRLGTSFGVPARNVLLVRRGTVRRTTSGKVQRRAMREQFLAGAVEALHTQLDPDVRRLTAVDPR